MLVNIENCSTERLYTIYTCYKEGISWAKKMRSNKGNKKRIEKKRNYFVKMSYGIYCNSRRENLK